MSESKTKRPSLFDAFPPVSTEEWEKIIKRNLNSADFKEKLRWQTGEGVTPMAFYRREDLEQVNRRTPIPKKYADKNPNSWEIREPIFASNIASANEKAQNALQRGAGALQFHLKIRRTEGMLGGDLQGLPIQNQQDFSDLLQDISLEEIPLHFDAGLSSPALLAMLWNEAQDQNIDQKPWATFSYDPYVYLLQSGQYPKGEEALKRDIRQLTQFTTQNLPEVRPLAVDARAYHHSGGTIVQELGYAMAAASEYLSILTEAGFEVDEVTDALHFSFSVGSNYFLEIAKFRAARLLWKNLVKAYGGDPDNGTYLHAETSRWNKTLYDPYSNMLRTSTEGMSAAIAGCDSMTILPFDEHFRQPDEFAQRIARNQQVIFSEEAYLDKVEDPAAGSYYIEKLTDQIGETAWELFQNIETEGGLLKAIEHGTVQSAIQDSQQKRDQAIANRGRIFVGTNQYSNADDKMADQIDTKFQTVSLDESEEKFDPDIENLPADLAKTFADGATIGDIIPHLFDFGKHQFRTVATYRGTQAFEELRLATERHDTTPKVLTLPMGNKKWRKGRSTFTANFFGCAGYDIEDPIGFENVDAAVDAIKEQKPDIAVICSSDKEYKKLVPAICKQLKKMNNRPIIVLAGYPKEDVETYQEAGVDEFIYSNCNVLETLKRFQQKLNII
jgi:methylmalonyl-CoA mutase